MVGLGTDEQAHRIAREAGCIYNPACDVSLVRVVGEELAGGVIFKSFTGASVNIHVAGFHNNWMRPELIKAVFEYTFVKLGCNKLFATVPVSNNKVIALGVKIGFTWDTIVRDVFLDGDMLILSMYRADCRWLA